MAKSRKKSKPPTIAQRIRAGYTPKTKYEKSVERKIKREAIDAIKSTDTKRFERSQTKQETATFAGHHFQQALDIARFGNQGAYAMFARVTYTDERGKKQTKQTETVALFGQSISSAVGMLGHAIAAVAEEYSADDDDGMEIELGFIFDETGGW